MSINSPFFLSLQTASWRGIPFGVTSSALHLGRKIAVHDYPYVDGVYAEDLGAKGKRIHIQGFLVEGGGAYGGKGTLKQQIEAFENANVSGNGIFIHPTLGERQSMVLQELEIDQDLQGRFASIKIALIENSVRPMLMVLANTQAQTLELSKTARKASLLDLLKQVKGLVRSIRNGVLGVVNRFTTLVRQVVFTATSLFSMITSLPGEIGRYIGSAFPNQKKSNGRTTAQLIGLGSASRINVLNNIRTLSAATDRMDIDAIAAGIIATVEAVYDANPDPVQAMTSMLALLQLPQLPLGTPDALGWNALNDLVRKAAVVCIAQATANRQFVSYDDAQSTRTLVCALLDHEIERAGDQGLDDSYNALLDLKVAVSQDLTRRGGNLSKVEQISVPASLPSLVWAQRLYQNSGREKELVQSANPVHPAFMPNSFKALSS